MTLSVRRSLAAAAATAALLALTGCGGDDSDSAADEAGTSETSSAASDSASAGATDGSDSGDSGDSAGDAPAEGSEITGEQFATVLKSALDQATTAHVTMDLGGAGKAEGDADYTKTPPELAMTMTIDQLGGDIEVRMVDGTIYLKSASMGTGDKWIAFPLDDPSSPLGDLGSQLDITSQLQKFADAVTSATYDGTEDVDGDELEHYTATVDTKKLVGDLGSSAGTDSVPESMTQEWWFDGDGYLRKFTTDMSGLAGGAGGAAGLGGDITATMDDWGTDVDIEAPPTDQTTSLPGM